MKIKLLILILLTQTVISCAHFESVNIEKVNASGNTPTSNIFVYHEKTHGGYALNTSEYLIIDGKAIALTTRDNYLEIEINSGPHTFQTKYKSSYLGGLISSWVTSDKMNVNFEPNKTYYYQINRSMFRTRTIVPSNKEEAEKQTVNRTRIPY